MGEVWWRSETADRETSGGKGRGEEEMMTRAAYPKAMVPPKRPAKPCKKK